jgi:N-acetylglucosaminyldiphosphoundecaprenol N-acetyl-beta-D-mannosaminyltransferase
MIVKVNLLGVEIDNLSFAEAVDRVIQLARGPGTSFVVTPNVDHLMRHRRDPRFRAVYADANLVLADGVPLLWASRLIRNRLKEKVSGSDLVPRLCARAAESGLSIYFLGGKPGAAERCAAGLVQQYPGLRVAGCSCPPFGFEKDATINGGVIAAVRDARPDILFVGLGAPKQELWIQRHREELGVPVALGIGASIDFLGGAEKRAPRWMQRVGLEWSYRLMRQPRRMWKRYLIDDAPFFLHVLAQALGRRPAYARSEVGTSTTTR